MRITFSSSFRSITYDNFLEQPLSMIKIRINQILAENSRLIFRLKKISSNPYVRKITNQEIKIVSEKN